MQFVVLHYPAEIHNAFAKIDVDVFYQNYLKIKKKRQTKWLKVKWFQFVDF